MTGLDWLLAASVIIWLGLGGYMAFLARTQRHIARRLAHLERERHE